MYVLRLLIGVKLVVLLSLAPVSTTHHSTQVSTIQQIESYLRSRRDEPADSLNTTNSEDSSYEVGWSKINEEVDIVIPLVLEHLNKLNFEFLQLPDMKETISLNPLFLSYEAGLYLTKGIVYNLAGIKRYGDAFMTYQSKTFLTKFYLTIKTLQFEYEFLLKLMALEGFGKVIGSLDDTIIYAELAVDIINMKLKLHDFRIVQFRSINVQLDQARIIRELSGLILSPITNLFKERITTSISDGLKDQMQIVMDDFQDADPLELGKFTKKILSGLTGQSNDNEKIKTRNSQ